MFIEEQLRGNMQTINELFSNAVARYGERPALSEPAEGDRMSTLTYRELQERAQQFAGFLQNEQFAKGDRLFLWSASRIDWLVAYLGALLVGVIVVPYKEHVLDSVGKPLPGVEVRIAADQEILVHGPNVAQGYWKNPEATAAAFKEGWYYSGDLGSWDTHGNLYLKGRKKNLIVLANGLNVYPEDIENILQQHPLVKDAVISGLMKQDEGPEIHAILLMEDPGQARAVVQQVNKQLASHQQIRGFTVWPETDFPRTHTLKVKRQDVLDKLPDIRAAQKKG
jgi:long-subunit acyl-CoA synthetase (AMP-forming)